MTPGLSLFWLLLAPLLDPLGFMAHMAQEVPLYEAQRALEPLSVDGVLSEPAWRQAPWTADFQDIRGRPQPSPPLRTRAKILWDDEYLYIGAHLAEPHIWATLQDRDAIIYEDDDFEIFLDPDGDGLAYFEIEINALGSVLDLFLEKPYWRGGRANISWNIPGLNSAVHLRGTLNDPSDVDEGWSVELAIPWADLVPPPSEAPAYESRPGDPRPGGGHPPDPGDEWRVNFSRVDWPLEVVSVGAFGDEGYRKARNPSRVDPHPEANWVWAPQGVIDMHRPERWGRIRFLGREGTEAQNQGPRSRIEGGSP